MSEQSSGLGREPRPASPPEQKVGDTPVALWDAPTPEEKAEARPVRRALREALAEVDSQEKADAVIDELAALGEDETVEEVAQSQPTPATTAEAAQQVKEAAQAAEDGEKTKEVLAETARVLATAEDREREAVSEAAQEILNPEQQGAPTVAGEQQREYLRHALLKRLKPYDALDASLFLKVNHLPHTRLLNRIFYTITLVFTGGAAWYVLMGLVTVFRPQFGWQFIRDAAVPLTIATSLVEHPIKRYFRRRRPFVTIVQAIVIGKKPGTWSFPSGHSATAFAGAWLFGRVFPRLRGLFYTVASLVAFSRIYLGDHYPGDVVSGSLLGALFAAFFQRLPWPWRPRPPFPAHSRRR